MKKLIFIVSLLSFGNIFAQKIIEREFDALEITAIEINSAVIYQIKVVSERTEKIKIITRIEGENYENVVLGIVEENNNTLSINTFFTPFFEAKNDKLAAHKVISIEMELIVPENIVIKIEAAITSVKLSGKYDSISVLLEDGNCFLNDFQGNALLKTKQGFITVYTSNKAVGVATSKYGKVINELSEMHTNQKKLKIKAESLNGDISLFKIH